MFVKTYSLAVPNTSLKLERAERLEHNYLHCEGRMIYAAPNESLDSSGGGVFRIIIGPAMLE